MIYKLISVTIIIGFCIPTCIKISRGKMVQNLATWVLWTLLDGITAIAIIFQNGNYWLPLAYAACSLATATAVLQSSSGKWTKSDTFVATLVSACIIVWLSAGSYYATIAGTTAVIIAGIPQLRDCWLNPKGNWFLRWIASFAASVLSITAGSSWTVEERLYPAAVAVYCGLCVIFTARKYFTSLSNKH